MNKILIALSIVLCALTAKAQTTTNITIKVTTDVVTGSSSNSASTSLTLSNLSKKDTDRVDGLSWAYFAARAGGFTNSFDNWIAKTWVKDNSDVTAASYNQSISADTALKITQGLLGGNYNAADRATLNTLANKAPAP